MHFRSQSLLIQVFFYQNKKLKKKSFTYISFHVTKLLWLGKDKLLNPILVPKETKNSSTNLHFTHILLVYKNKEQGNNIINEYVKFPFIII